MKKHKYFAVALSLAIVVGGTLTGCGSSSDNALTAAVDSVTNTLPSQITRGAINTVEELNTAFNAHEITVADVRRAIDQNPNLTGYRELLNQFISDVERARPNHNWWVFYQNVQRMEITTVEGTLGDGGQGAWGGSLDGTFDFTNSNVVYRSDLSASRKTEILRHEWVHALDGIVITYQSRRVDTTFHDHLGSRYGESITEALTSAFNTHISSYTDPTHVNIVHLLRPLIDQISMAEAASILFEGDIYTFIEAARPYYEDIETLVTYLDTFFRFNNRRVDADFFERFTNRIIHFYVTAWAQRLDNNIVTQREYDAEMLVMRPAIYGLISRQWEANIPNQTFMSIVEYDALFSEIEQQILN